jgi:hypothetical protein
MLTREDFVLLHGTGLITAIDHADREMSLQTSDGRIETFTVDKRVKRFNEAKVGDTVSVAYYLGYNAEVRPPTAAEEQNPLVVLDTSSRAGANAPPAASNMRQIRAVVTIEAMDRVNQTLTVKGPRGKYFTARVKDPSRMEQVHIGDTIVMTFTEAAAVVLGTSEIVKLCLTSPALRAPQRRDFFVPDCGPSRRRIPVYRAPIVSRLTAKPPSITLDSSHPPTEIPPQGAIHTGWMSNLPRVSVRVFEAYCSQRRGGHVRIFIHGLALLAAIIVVGGALTINPGHMRVRRQLRTDR